jgi:hypothetical protein
MFMVRGQVRVPFPCIVGAPRSGTTLLRFMLDAHPDLAIPPETGFLPRAAWLLPPLFLRSRLFRLITHYPRSRPNWADYQMQPAELWEAWREVRPFSIAEGVRAFYRLYAQQHGKSRFGDKTPMYARAMPAIRALLPEVRFIHIIRDGRDVALSLRKMPFTPSQEIAALACYWKRIVSTARADGKRSGAYLELRYEDLIANPESNLRVVCDFLRLDFDACMLDYWKRTPERLTEFVSRYGRDGRILSSHEERLDRHRLTTCPPDRSRAGAWRETMTGRESAAFYDVAGSLLAEIGYGRNGCGKVS